MQDFKLGMAKIMARGLDLAHQPMLVPQPSTWGQTLPALHSGQRVQLPGRAVPSVAAAT